MMDREQLTQKIEKGERIFNGVSFRRANLSEMNLAGMYFCNASFEDADLRNTDFSGSTLIKANFTGADLRGSCFARANLEYAELAFGQGLAEANFAGTNLLAANLSPSQLRELGVEEPRKEYSPYAPYDNGRHPFRLFS